MGQLFLLGVVPRLIAASVLTIYRPQGLFPDEVVVLKSARGIVHGDLEASSVNLWNSNWSFFRPVVYLTELLRDPAVAGRLFGIISGGCLTLLIYLAGRRISETCGIRASALYALFPSQILWSSLALKDSFVALLVASVFLLIVSLTGMATSQQRIKTRIFSTALTALIGCLLFIALTGARLYTAGALVFALVLAYVIRLLFLRSWLKVSVVLSGVLIALFSAPTLNFVVDGTRGNENLRQLEYETANTLISCDAISLLPGSEPTDAGWIADFSCLPYSLRMILFDPFPNQWPSSSKLVFLSAENLIWWPMLVSAFWISVRNLKRDQPDFVILCLTSFLLISALQWALIDRVIGTAVRHRTDFFWAACILAAAFVDTIQSSRTKPEII